MIRAAAKISHPFCVVVLDMMILNESGNTKKVSWIGATNSPQSHYLHFIAVKMLFHNYTFSSSIVAGVTTRTTMLKYTYSFVLQKSKLFSARL
jgi:hypothetical protein